MWWGPVNKPMTPEVRQHPNFYYLFTTAAAPSIEATDFRELVICTKNHALLVPLLRVSVSVFGGAHADVIAETPHPAIARVKSGVRMIEHPSCLVPLPMR